MTGAKGPSKEQIFQLKMSHRVGSGRYSFPARPSLLSIVVLDLKNLSTRSNVHDVASLCVACVKFGRWLSGRRQPTSTRGQGAACSCLARWQRTCHLDTGLQWACKQCHRESSKQLAIMHIPAILTEGLWPF